MKAERRHELKQNALAKNLENAPAFFQKYGSRLLLGVTLCLLAFVLYRNYSTGKVEKAKRAATDLGQARYTLSMLRNMDLSSPERMAQNRREYVKEIDESLRDALAQTADPKVKAEAMLLRGDLNWELANFPPLPGSTTRPELGTEKSSDEYLRAAEEAYNEILQAPLNQNSAALTTARLSLAAVAENREQWDKARQMYQQVIDDGMAAKELRDVARARQEALTTLAKPVLLGGPAPLPDFLKPKLEAPTTLPAGPIGPLLPPISTTQPFPSSAPATQPATTQPFTVAPGISTTGPAISPATTQAADATAPAVK